MLISASKLINYPALSLHTGGPIGRTVKEIVDPNELQIVAWELKGPTLGTAEAGNLMLSSSVREFSNIGMIIDSVDELVSKGDVVKVDKAIDLGFSPVGLKVVTKKGSNLGKVIDYTVDTDTFRLMQLVIKRPTLKAFLDPELVIGRSQIAEVDDYKITVRDEEDKLHSKSKTDDFVPNFVNPFREARLSANHKESPAVEDTE